MNNKYIRFFLGFSIPIIIMLFVLRDSIPEMYSWVWVRASSRSVGFMPIIVYMLTHYYQNFPKLIIVVHLLFIWKFYSIRVLRGALIYSLFVFFWSGIGHGFNLWFVNVSLTLPLLGMIIYEHY